MRLEQITIHGFKSFAEKTEVRVFRGITCIVGPNGCGKSNVADAIRWALGEQSAKMLRGHKMEDVIFHGSASRKPVGLAEVSLLFSNDGALHVPWSEVGVARRLYRTGESEYLLNRSVCRLRDIQDLFAGTGVNPKAYALMDQERLNHVLTAKPWERRIFIEEAAGVARYKQQRGETQGKLDGARQNLQRVRDVMDEVKRQLGSIERQARKAQQYKALHQERQGLALALLATDFAGLAALHATLAAEMATLRDHIDEQDVLIAGLTGRQASERARIQTTEYRLADLRQSLQKIQGEAERLLERREQLGIQIRELGDEDVRLAEEMRAAGERRLALAEEGRDKAAALDEAAARGADVVGRIADLETQLAVCQEQLSDRRERLEVLRVEQFSVAGARAELTREDAELRERSGHIARRRERLAAELAAARSEGEAVTGQRVALDSDRRRLDQELSDLGAERHHVLGGLEARDARRTRLDAELGDLRLDLAGRQSRLEALERLEREREGYGAGVRAVFAASGASQIPGVVGTVADLLEVPAELEAAIESVLGDRLQWVVVERFAEARSALGFLAREGAGAATFLPLETLPPGGDAPEDSSEVRWAQRLVGGPHAALRNYLLGRVGVVSHLDAAEVLWRRNGVVATYVTPGGEVLFPTGRLTGGRREGEREGQELSILRRKRAIKQLREEIESLRLDAEERRAALTALGAEIALLRSQEAALGSRLQAQEARRLASEKDLEAYRRDEDRLRRHVETLLTEAEALDGEGREAAGRLDEVAAALVAAVAREAGLERAMAADREGLAQAQQAESLLVADLTARRVEQAAVTERLDALGRDLERIEELGREAAARLEQTGRRRAELAERRAELGRDRERADAGAREVAAARDREEAEVTAVAERHRAELASLATVETDLRAGGQRRARLTERLHEIEVQEAEQRVRREDLVLQAHRGHGIEGAEALLALHDPARDVESTRARHEELSTRLEGLGPVNLVADEEYRDLEERLIFLRTQHDDLTASIKDLERALRGMTRTAQERFQQAFDEINVRFGEIFSRLFEGGRAELRMVEPEEGAEDPLELGVELMAQPRGKRLQAVTLMSGGEKALTGLALLFAIFYFRPSPFCVLDEVDAPLDDANIHRFLRVLRELCARTQFLVITHNRKTMEAADLLYGVTMEEPGLSRLVSVRLAEA
jgi:chromosome segregation protein